LYESLLLFIYFHFEWKGKRFLFKIYIYTILSSRTELSLLFDGFLLSYRMHYARCGSVWNGGSCGEILSTNTNSAQAMHKSLHKLNNSVQNSIAYPFSI